jgi:hypothetical protein
MDGVSSAHVAELVGYLDPRGISQGVVADGTWNSAEGTISIIDGESFSAIPPDQPIVLANAPVLTNQVGDQTGPLPGDTVVSLRTHGGFVSVFHHVPDNSPGVPAGERWIQLRNASDPLGDPLGQLKITQNGATSDDGAGGFNWGGGSLVGFGTTGGLTRQQNDATTTIQDVAGTTSTTLDATSQTVTHAAGDGGVVKTIVDGNGNAISHVVSSGGLVGLGALAPSIASSDNAAIAKTHLDTTLSNVDAQFLANASTLVTQLHTAGAFASSFNLASFVALLVAGFFGSTAKATGSETVFMKLP